MQYALPSGKSIRLIDPVHFVATKLEAFAGRGENDVVMSHDLEDIVCVLDGRRELEDEIAQSAQEIRRYVCECLRELLRDSHFMDALPGHLPGDASSQARLPSLISKLERLAAFAA